jgi:Zn-dependent peptidase ImmA (M78 family)/transcriptional regulator with XRE-family HTH domain
MSERVNPELIVLAREVIGLTQGDLAKAIGASQSKISKYESGMLEVSAEDLSAIARVVERPERFFMQAYQKNATGSSCIYHRKRQSLTGADARRIYAMMEIIHLEVAWLLRGVQIDFTHGLERMDIDKFDGDPELIASRIRANWGYGRGPIPDLVNAVERAGGVVVRCRFGTEKVDAVSRRWAGLPPLIFVNADQPADRLRFTLAHEIGHLIMHAVPMTDVEPEADRFAAELLMPAAEIRAEFRRPITLQSLAALKPRWKVSMKALAYRAQSLGILSQYQAARLFQQMAQMGWSKGEPLPIPDEQPTVIRDVIAVHQTQHNFNTRDLCEMARCNEGYFRFQYLPEEQRGLRLAN